MAERDYAEELLESANAFFEEHEATEVIRKFLESDQVGNIVDNAYNEMKKTIGGYVEGAPEDLMEKAKELEEMFCGDEAKEHFQKDFKANFKRRLAGTLDVLPEFIKADFIKHALSKLAEENNKAALKDVQDIANDMRNLQTQNYLSELCTGYVPSDIPEGLKILFDIVGMLGPVIPGSILMPELRDEEDDTAEEGTSDR